MDLTSLQPHQKQFIPGTNSFVTQQQQQQMSDQNNGHYKQMSQPALMPQLISNHQQTQPAQQQQQQLSFHRPSRSVVHVRENSIDELDALFDPSKWSMRKTNNLPLTKRNLPQSFFKPPETGGTKTPKLINSNQHSRQNSIDQTNMLNHSNLLNQQHLLVQQKLNNLNGSPLNNNNNNTGLPVLQSHLSSNFHTRSISEPVAAALSPFNVNQTQFNHQQQQQQQQQQQHQLAKNNQQIQTNPNVLPYGWRTAKTQQGQRYFINYITKQTSWTIPTQAVTNSSSLSYYDQAQSNQIENFISSSSSTSSSPVLNLTNMNNPSDIDLNNLNNPHHMSSGINTHLNIDVKNDCMLNSIGLSTLSSSTSASVSASDDDLIAEFQQNQQLELQQQLEKLENQQQLEFILNQIQMPSGWEKAQTAKGEVYFINHNTKSTYWEDPRIALIPNFLKQKKLKITSNRGNQQNEITNLNNQNNNMLSPFNINTSNLIFNGQNPTSSSNLINNNEVNIELTNNNNNIISNNNETSFENVQTNQIDIKSLIVEVINKKKELFKSLEDLNKQESFLRAQLNAAFSNCGLPAGLNSSSNEFSLNFEENFDCMETSNKTGENINSFSNGIINDLNVNDKLNPIQSSKSVSSSSSPSSITSLMSNSSNNSNNMSYYQNALKSNNLENYNNSFQPNNNHSNSESCLSNNNNNNNDIKILRKNQNGENLLSIIKTESVNPQITDQLDAVSSLYNKLLINNGQNAQFQIEQNTLINNSSMQNKIIDFI